MVCKRVLSHSKCFQVDKSGTAVSGKKFSIMTSSAGRDVITGRCPGFSDLKLTFF